jgi:hypothetical protein
MYALEREWFESEIDLHNRLLRASGVDDLTFISEAPTESIGIDCDRELTRHWFNSFEEAIAHCKAQRPNANWEEAGW